MPATATTKSIRETELVPLATEIKRLAELVNNEKRDFTAEEKEKWDKVNKDYESTKARVEALERAESIHQDLRTSPANPGIRDALRFDYDGYKEMKRLRKEEKAGKRAAKQKALEERHAQLKARQERRLGWQSPSITEQDRCFALQGWCRAQTGRDLKWYHREACQKLRVNPRVKDLRINALLKDYQGVRRMAAPYLSEHRASPAQALNANVAGGYLVPEGFVQNLEIALLQYSNIRNVADVMRTMSGQDLPWPSANDTFNKGQILVENATVNTGPTVVFAQTILHAYKYTSNLIPVPVELLEDSAFDLAAILGNLLGIRIARIQNDHMTFGTGVAQPTGITVAATQGVQAASPTALAWDDLYKLEHAVDPAYRSSALGTGWMFHDQILSWLKRLKDGAGRYLWQSGVAQGVPDTIDGWPYTINQSMSPTMASGNKTVLYGAMKKFKVRDVTQVRLRRLVERFADVDQEAFVMFARFDATLLDAGTHPIQYVVH